MAAPAALPLPEAARQLGIGASTLRRWVAAGAPTARRGRPGRGGQALYDPQAIASWRAAGSAPKVEPTDQALDVRAALLDLPELIVETIAGHYRDVEGPHKRALAAEFAAVAYLILFALEDRIGIPAVEHEQLEQLRQIAEL